MNTLAIDYLESRAERHGMTYSDLMDMTPSNVADCPQEAMAFWEQRDISHKYPQLDYPWISDEPSNMMPEDPSVNRSRGAEVMTDLEIFTAEQDNQVLADTIDSDFLFFGFA